MNAAWFPSLRNLLDRWADVTTHLAPVIDDAGETSRTARLVLWVVCGCFVTLTAAGLWRLLRTGK